MSGTWQNASQMTELFALNCIQVLYTDLASLTSRSLQKPTHFSLCAHLMHSLSAPAIVCRCGRALLQCAYIFTIQTFATLLVFATKREFFLAMLALVSGDIAVLKWYLELTQERGKVTISCKCAEEQAHMHQSIKLGLLCEVQREHLSIRKSYDAAFKQSLQF